MRLCSEPNKSADDIYERLKYKSYTIILNNVPLHDDIWLTVFVWLSTDKICRADKSRCKGKQEKASPRRYGRLAVYRKRYVRRPA